MDELGNMILPVYLCPEDGDELNALALERARRSISSFNVLPVISSFNNIVLFLSVYLVPT